MGVYAVAFITATGAVGTYGRRDRAFTSEIILLYGQISIRTAGKNSGNAADANDINVDLGEGEGSWYPANGARPSRYLFGIKLFVSG